MKLALIVLATTLSLAGCASISAKEEVRNKVAAACADKPNESARERCVDNELAMMTAADRAVQRSRYQQQLDRENREALRQAYGVPREYSRESYDNGLRIPGAPR